MTIELIVEPTADLKKYQLAFNAVGAKLDEAKERRAKQAKLVNKLSAEVEAALEARSLEQEETADEIKKAKRHIADLNHRREEEAEILEAMDTPISNRRAAITEAGEDLRGEIKAIVMQEATQRAKDVQKDLEENLEDWLMCRFAAYGPHGMADAMGDLMNMAQSGERLRRVEDRSREATMAMHQALRQ